MKLSFWISIFIIVYTFLGYGILLYLTVRIRRILKGKRSIPNPGLNQLPTCTLVVAAFNEEGFITEKISNTLALNYPPDGSSDRTPEIIARYPEITLLHQPQRNGKIAAVHRAVEQVDTEIIVFTDANTFLNADALLTICRHYTDSKVGAVAGEKRVCIDKQADASAAGEGFYWKYESKLKKWDSELYSVVGAAGELFSVRKELYQPVSPDSILDDFMISMRIAEQGYRIIYEPDAYATETASENVTEELKRKVRIAAGGIQSVIWLKSLLNIFKYGVLSFQYISHRVLRWTVTPFLILLVFALNIILAIQTNAILYQAMLAAQLLFYILAGLGYLLERKHLRVKILFIPYYFCVMNYAVLAGMLRYFKNEQSASWEKSKRK
jgi:cellulose synthase/poly-beta-1,6-N-acetylglucosamine synthase-like glycosyltransferase